jgi:ABC-type branched-subunit amino acid transport system ATPase component
MDLLQALRAAGKTIVFVSHNMEVVRQLSDHVIVMYCGNVLAQGSVDVLEREEVRQAYLGT